MAISREVQLQLIAFYKGINPELVSEFSEPHQGLIFNRMMKELCLLAESNAEGAGHQLYQIVASFKPDEKNFEQLLTEVESLVEYGRSYESLNSFQRAKVKRLELQQEFGHFSRIMNLDRIIFGKKAEPWKETLDFARFFELLQERRSDRHVTSLGNWGRARGEFSYEVNNSPVCGLLEESLSRRQVALLAVPEKYDEFSPKYWLSEYAKLCDRLGTQTATFLFDYLLFVDTPKNLSFVTAFLGDSCNGPEVRVIGGGGCGLMALVPEKGSQFKDVVDFRTTVGSDWGFGSNFQSRIERIAYKPGNERGKILCFHPDSWKVIGGLSDGEINILVGKRFKNGWFNSTNALRDFFKERGLIDQFVVLDIKRKPLGEVVTQRQRRVSFAFSGISGRNEFSELIGAKEVILEAAHIHADRRPGKEQIDAIRVFKKTIKLMEDKGFSGVVRKQVMVDDYHVVNNLDYKSFSDKLLKLGFEFDELILESSPVVRWVAIEILATLLALKNRGKDFEVVCRGGNLYLEISSLGVSIELVAGIGNENVLGCVLFDVALCVYKLHQEYFDLAVREQFGMRGDELHSTILSHYGIVKDPVERLDFVKKYIARVAFPTLREIEGGGVKSKGLPSDSRALNLNILAQFYRPQQKKVNRFLALIGQPKLFSIFYDSANGTVSLEGGADEE